MAEFTETYCDVCRKKIDNDKKLSPNANIRLTELYPNKKDSKAMISYNDVCEHCEKEVNSLLYKLGYLSPDVEDEYLAKLKLTEEETNKSE